MKKFFIYFLFLSMLSACESAKEGFTLKKKNNSDEFLIEKKEPLTQPPDFKNIPEPGSINSKAKTEQNSIEKILRTSQSQSTSNQTKSSSTEEFILNQIKK